MDQKEWDKHMGWTMRTLTSERRSIYLAHRTAHPDCPECKARQRTRIATARQKAVREVYRDMGLVRVRGTLGGIYYE